MKKKQHQDVKRMIPTRAAPQQGAAEVPQIVLPQAAMPHFNQLWPTPMGVREPQIHVQQVVDAKQMIPVVQGQTMQGDDEAADRGHRLGGRNR